MSDIEHACGLMGIIGVKDAAVPVWLGLHALQHRGQEGAGIASYHNGRFNVIKDMGLLEQAVPVKRLPELIGDLAIGHVRYPASGANIIQNVQPTVIDYSRGVIAIGHNGGLVNSKMLRDEYEAYGSIFQTSTDAEVLVHLLAKPSHQTKPNPLAHCLGHLKGAFCFVIAMDGKLIGARDPQGIRPLVLGKFPDGGWALASETVAFDIIGAHYVREIEPGEMVTITPQGPESLKFVEEREIKPAHCVFEHVYFARPDSAVFGENVHLARMNFGRALAREAPIDADLVSAIPDSGTSAALGYSRESGIPFDRALMRNFYVGRTFIAPEQKARQRAVNLKLNVVCEVVRDKRVILVDDSLVRGTTVTNLVRMVRDAGAAEVHLKLSCQPLLYPCFYGTDFPSRSELIAANHAVEEIRRIVDADTLSFLSLDGMLSSLCMPPNHYCTACFTGRYPVPKIDPPDRYLPGSGNAGESGRFFDSRVNIRRKRG